MRCLHVKASLDLRLGGTVQAVYDICRASESVGDICEVATIKSGPASASLAGIDADPTLRVHEFSSSWPARLGNSWPLARWLLSRVRGYDLVEIHEVFTAATVAAAVIARFANVPYTVRPHGSLDPFDLQKHRIAKLVTSPIFGGLVLGGAAAICFTSEEERSRARIYGSRALQYTVPLPVHPARTVGDRGRFRREIGVGDRTFVALFLGRIDYKKGLAHLLRAVHRIRAEGGDVHLVIAGHGTTHFLSSIHSIVGQLAIQDIVHFAGFLTGQRKADAFAGADGFFLLSDNENFGIAVIESLYAGTPTVISDRVDIAPELAAASAALMVEPNDNAAVQAIRRLMDDPTLRARLSEAGPTVANARFNPASIADREKYNRARIVARRAHQTHR